MTEATILDSVIARMREQDAKFADSGTWKRNVFFTAARSLDLPDNRAFLLFKQLAARSSNITSRVYQYKPGATMVAPVRVVPTVIQPVVKLQQPDMPRHVMQYIPAKSDLFIKNDIFNTVGKILKSGIWCPVYLTGPSGTGKSSAVMQSHAQLGRGIIRINCTKITDDDVLIGSKTIKGGDIEIVEGPIITAMRQGLSVLLDEIDLCNPNSIMTLQGILEGGQFYFPLKDEYITPAPGFNIFATGNTRGKGSEDGRYIGTQTLNEAFLDRFAMTFEVQHPSETEERKIINAMMLQRGIDNPQFAKELTRWSASIRTVFATGSCDEEVSTRRLLHIVTAYAIFGDKRQAVKSCLARFDASTRDAFYNLFDKICSEEVAEQISDQVMKELDAVAA